LSNGSPKCDTIVGQVQKNANGILEDQIDDGGKDGNAPASERAALGTLNASIEVAIEDIIDGAGRATHKD
jgi:hypothetical protein